MKEDQDVDNINLKRRRFLLTAGSGSVAAGVIAASGGRVPAPVATAQTTPKAGAGGYSESAHVRNYYRTTRV